MEFKVRVKIQAECEYEMTVDAESEAAAEMYAEKQWRDQLPSDFQVDRGYITDTVSEVEQLSWECHECDRPITEEENRRFDEMCPRCYLLAVDPLSPELIDAPVISSKQKIA